MQDPAMADAMARETQRLMADPQALAGLMGMMQSNPAMRRWGGCRAASPLVCCVALACFVFSLAELGCFLWAAAGGTAGRERGRAARRRQAEPRAADPLRR